MSWLSKYKKLENDSPAVARLDRMAAACREVTGDTLSPEARDGILNAVRNAAPRHDSLPVLFTPTRRLLLTGALPLLLAGVLLLTLNDGMQPPAVGVGGAPTVRMSKEGDQVLLHIANGGRPHYVSRSTQADRFEPSSAVRVSDGVYAERLSDRAGLVFYRID